MIILTFPFNQIQMLNPTAGSAAGSLRPLDFYMGFFDPNKAHYFHLLYYRQIQEYSYFLSKNVLNFANYLVYRWILKAQLM